MKNNNLLLNRMKTVNSIENLDLYLDKQHEIKIKGYTGRYRIIKNFMRSFTTGKLNGLDTLYVTNDRIQCYEKRSRSIIDLLLVCRTHHPKWTTTDILLEFKKLYNSDMIVGHRCNDINRIVFKVKEYKSSYCLGWGNYIKRDNTLTKGSPIILNSIFKDLEENNVDTVSSL